MMPRRLPLRSDTVTSEGPFPAAARPRVSPAGWTRKTFAMAMHIACLGLFGLTVVWPLASPIASGELAREFKPVVEAFATGLPQVGPALKQKLVEQFLFAIAAAPADIQVRAENEARSWGGLLRELTMRID